MVVLLTGLNHSGKSTFASELYWKYDSIITIDNDTRRDFATKHYNILWEKANKKEKSFENPDLRLYHLKTMLRFWLEHDIDICLSNCHSSKKYRKDIVDYVHWLWDKVIIIYFDIDHDILHKRALEAETHKNPNFYSWVDRWADEMNWTQRILDNLEWMKEHYEPPTSDEWDHFFTLHNNVNHWEIIKNILSLLT